MIQKVLAFFSSTASNLVAVFFTALVFFGLSLLLIPGIGMLIGVIKKLFLA